VQHPSKLLTELSKQHDALRAMIDACEKLADELDAGEGDPSLLTREVAKLRVAFDAHNKFEEQLLRPVLREIDAFGEVRIERMIADHIGEHHAVREHLGDGPVAVLRAALDQLRVHLQAEERYFLSSKVLRDDLITVEGGG
jgi:hypothetical protein